MQLGSNLRFAICAVGIFVCYFGYGIIQEKITRGKYVFEGKEERFTAITALVFFQCAVNYIYALIMSYVFPTKEKDTTKSSYYGICSLTYLVAMVTSNKALSWVNYPTQVIGKSCKPIPVMILGVLLGRKRYPLLKYLFILMIVAGVAMFMYKENAKKSGGGDSLFGVGELLLLVSLTCDGLTGAVQERMKLEHGTKSGHMMLAMNKWSCGFLSVAILGSGEGLEFVSFIQRHPAVLWHLASFSVASALGQFFIFMCVSEFGPLPCSIVTTTRKFFTVLGSVILFGNSLLPHQWCGAVLVFTGIFLDGAYGKQKPKPEPEKVQQD